MPFVWGVKVESFILHESILQLGEMASNEFSFDGFQLQLHEKHVMHGNSMMQEAQHICLGRLNVRHQQLLMAFMYKFTSRTCSEIFEMQRWQSFLDFFGLSAGTFSNIGRLYRNLAWKKILP